MCVYIYTHNSELVREHAYLHVYMEDQSLDIFLHHGSPIPKEAQSQQIEILRQQATHWRTWRITICTI